MARKDGKQWRPRPEDLPPDMEWCMNMSHRGACPIEMFAGKPGGGLYKTCSDCRERKRKEYSESPDLQEKAQANANAYYLENKEACLSASQQRRLNNPEAYFDARLRREFNITTEGYYILLEKQNGVCAICEGTNANGNRLGVDHDHSCCPGQRSCGKCVRGLLCIPCNTGLGNLQDDHKLLLKAAEYLELHDVPV